MGVPPTPDTSDDLESMNFLAGQSAALVKEGKPAAEVIRELVEGAQQILSQLAADYTAWPTARFTRSTAF